MKKFLFNVCCLCAWQLFPQDVLNHVQLSSKGKDMDLVNMCGLKSVIRGAGTSAGAMTPVIEVVNLDNNGFIIREKNVITKYTDQFKQEWAQEVGFKYKRAETFGNSKGIYFMETAYPLDRINLNHFDRKGQINSSELKFKNKYSPFFIKKSITTKGLNLIAVNTEKEVSYYLISIDVATMSFTEQKLEIPFDEEEKIMYKEDKSYYGWRSIGENKGNIVLGQSRIAKTAKNESFVLKTIEIDSLGGVHDLKAHVLKKQFTENKIYHTPLLYFDEARQTIRGSEFYQSKRDQLTVDGYYFVKCNYNNDYETSFKEYNFESLGEEYSAKIGRYASSYYDEKQDLYHLWTNGKSNYEMGYLKIKGSTGSIKDFSRLTYENPVGIIPFWLLPKKGEKVVNSETAGKCPIDFINKMGETVKDTDGVFFEILRKDEYDIVIMITEKTGTIDAYQLKK